MQSFTTTPKFLEICLKCGRELRYNRLDDPDPITNENILKCYNCKIVFIKERDENIIYIFSFTFKIDKQFFLKIITCERVVININKIFYKILIIKYF